MEQIPLIDLRAQYRTIKPEIDKAIRRVLDSGRFILGPEVEAFEREIAAYCGTRHAVGVASGTDALELVLRACGVGPGDEVIVPALTFFATAGAVAALGARPVFVDIEPVTYGIDPRLIKRAITPKTKAIVPVHLYGHPCDMTAVLKIAKAHRLTVIEDCAQAIGAAVGMRRVGSFGDAAIISFYPSKNLGAYGDGGLVVTNRRDLAERVRLLRMHGSRDRVRHEVVSRNSRLDELQAAVLRVKLRHLEAWNAARRRHAAAYRRALEARRPEGLVLPQERAGARHVYHLYAVRTPHRARVRRALARYGVATQIHYEVPLHLQPAFALLGYRRGKCPTAERVTEDIFSLPMYPELTPRQIDAVARHVRAVLNAT